MKFFNIRGFRSLSFVAAIAALSAVPVLAQDANFGTITLAPGFQSSDGSASGYTGGDFSLSSMANSDRHNNRCIGFGDPTPDHLLVLQEDFPQLSLQVNSNGQDTTLFIQGPDNSTIRCGDDTGSSKDASVADSEWSAGTYRIWVGTFDAGAKYNYTLSIQQ